MFDFRTDYMETIRKEIHDSANRVRQESKPNWYRVREDHVCFLSDYLGNHKWCIDFYDEDYHWHGVSFERPPHAGDRWYREEIARQLADN
jgi:hypothetical protein